MRCGCFSFGDKSFGFSANKNDLIRETDARGNETGYVVDEETSRNEEVVDRCGNKTAYEYDEAGNTTKVTGKDADDVEQAHVEYAYDGFNNLTEITRGDGMKYSLVYNAYHQLKSIGVAGAEKPLTAYTYKNGNGRLKEVTYANGHTMKATYNSIGQMIGEKWVDAANSVMAHYRYVYDGQGNIVRSIDFMQKKEYNYFYEEEKLIRANECSIEVDENLNVIGKVVDGYILYTFDSDGNQTKKEICIGGETRAYYYEHSEDKEVVTSFWVDGKYVTSHSKSDQFGRKIFEELQLGGGFVSRQFAYHAGEVTEEHKKSNKLKSSPTTNLVSQMVLSDGRTLSYEYDAEERITKVIDSVDGTTEYTYDALGQLLAETKDGVVINTMTYDNYGNILSKNGIAYTYDDPIWKDKLTGYGEQTITYDEQGNPVNYLGHTLTWEKGRQLKSFDDITYTYNANGVRTSKTVDGVTHTYFLENSKILKETWGNNTLIPLYNNEDEVCGIIYKDVILQNGVEKEREQPFYFLKNQQGDIISITDKTGETVAKYSYDAWGVCAIVEDTTECKVATINPFRYRGYYYDNETGLYYLQSRYYDPNVGHFLNGDESTFATFPYAVLEHNLFTYCCNDSINNADYNGYALETILDVASIIWSLIDLIQTPSWVNVGYLLWDLAALIPFVPGSYIAKGGKLCIKIANKIGDFSKGTKFLTGSYKKLRKVFKGVKNIEIHHLIEKRFKILFKKVKSTDDYLSIPLSKDLHKIITQRWRKCFPYGTKYSKITKTQMRKAIKNVYKDTPQLLEETLRWFEKNWKKG